MIDVVVVSHEVCEEFFHADGGGEFLSDGVALGVEHVPEEEVKPRLEETLQLYRKHGASWDMLDTQRDTIRQELAATIRMEKLLAHLMGDDDNVSEKEITDFYQEFLDDYRTLPEANPLHLMKIVAEHDSPKDLYQHMINLRQEALNGADFAELATRETDKQTKDIDLDWIPLDRPTNPFETVLFSLNKNEISPVLTYEHAFHIIKVIDTKPATLTPLEDVHEEVKNRTLARKKRNALQTLANTLRENATIENVDFSGEEE